ncbi:MAG TPA: DUF3188 domain-containing protein [Synechococcales bacterium UBA10510]|nr:DUF3188 domain-containing protein [Synechococcales bacterium UBA10510]
MAAPLLILLCLIALTERRGVDRLAALPPLLIGIGLLVTNRWGQLRRRRRLLHSLRQERLPISNHSRS